jgi:hypothetical protein
VCMRLFVCVCACACCMFVCVCVYTFVHPLVCIHIYIHTYIPISSASVGAKRREKGRRVKKEPLSNKRSRQERPGRETNVVIVFPQDFGRVSARVCAYMYACLKKGQERHARKGNMVIVFPQDIGCINARVCVCVCMYA